MKPTRCAICPTCERRGRFQAAGEQHWPDEVAEAHGVPATITLWTCPHCGTTISELDLRPFFGPRRRRATSPG